MTASTPRTIPTVNKDKETFIMETTLKNRWTKPNLLIKGNHQWITVWISKRKILYQRKDYQEESNPGLSLAVIDLPANYISEKN